jgi:hypothetical protein
MVRPRTDHLLDAHRRMAWRIKRRAPIELVGLGDALLIRSRMYAASCPAPVRGSSVKRLRALEVERARHPPAGQLRGMATDGGIVRAEDIRRRDGDRTGPASDRDVQRHGVVPASAPARPPGSLMSRSAYARSATLDGPEVVTIDPFRFDDVATEGESGEATEPGRRTSLTADPRQAYPDRGSSGCGVCGAT